MPSGPAELHEKWGDDGAAWDFLKSRGFTNTMGIINVKNDITTEEASAVNYLITEWDWDYG